jgi:electron transport complex protein RnfB
MVRVARDTCVGCGGCVDLCPRTAIRFVKDRAFIESALCLECKTCVKVCPVKAPQEI